MQILTSGGSSVAGSAAIGSSEAADMCKMEEAAAAGLQLNPAPVQLLKQICLQEAAKIEVGSRLQL